MKDLREGARLDALRQLNLLDTPPSEAFDRVTRMASQIFDLPIAAVSLTDLDRQWFKSRVGVDHTSIPREKAPCAQCAENSEVLVIPTCSPTPITATPFGPQRHPILCRGAFGDQRRLRARRHVRARDRAAGGIGERADVAE